MTPFSPLAYPMITHTHPITGTSSINALFARQWPCKNNHLIIHDYTENETTLPPSISLELNLNNAYDFPCRQRDFEPHLEMIPMKDVHDIVC